MKKKEKRAEKERVTSREREKRAEKENEKNKKRERNGKGEGEGLLRMEQKGWIGAGRRGNHSSSARNRNSSTRTNGRIGSAGIERRSHRTRPESKEENAHEVSIVDGQRQWSAKGEETNPRWRIEDAS